MLFFPFFAYAEIHYKLPFLKPKYYKKEPEIIFDAPIRCLTYRSDTLPISLIIKDSHLFPVTICQADFIVQTKEQTWHYHFDETIHLISRFFYKIYEIPILPEWHDRFITINAILHFNQKNKKRTIRIDNYYQLDKELFKCFVSSEPRPVPDQYYCGEPHYHSNYTDDQVEFGAPVEIASRFAHCMGLDWFFVTDHSYDLDDCEENYLQYDPGKPKWKRLSEEINYFDNQKCRIIKSEEASVGNCQNRNVHLLCINQDHFIEGKGDSAEKWGKNKPDFTLKELPKLHHQDCLFIAAHPFESVPPLQKITLNRGIWNDQDYTNAQINYLQGINNASLPKIRQNIKKWVHLLLTGHRYYLLAGNDAHGNFQFMKQIKNPFLKLFSTKNQIFGRFFTIFYHKENQPVDGIKNNHLILTNGPFLDFTLTDTQKYCIGQTIPSTSATLEYEIKTSQEFGKISSVTLIIGDLKKKCEEKTENPLQLSQIILPCNGYIRMELKTVYNGFAMTNPIWIERNDDAGR